MIFFSFWCEEQKTSKASARLIRNRIFIFYLKFKFIWIDFNFSPRIIRTVRGVRSVRTVRIKPFFFLLLENLSLRQKHHWLFLRFTNHFVHNLCSQSKFQSFHWGIMKQDFYEKWLLSLFKKGSSKLNFNIQNLYFFYYLGIDQFIIRYWASTVDDLPRHDWITYLCLLMYQLKSQTQFSNDLIR